MASSVPDPSPDGPPAPAHDDDSTCPVCGSDRTFLNRSDVCDLEYHVEPARRLVIWKCSHCDSEFVHPRPTEDELPAFYPSDYHAYNEDHGPVARLLVAARARARARYYQGLLSSRHGRLFDVGTGDCRHFDELREYCDIECAGVEIQPDVAARGRERGYDVLTGTLESADLSGHEGRYDIVSMNHVLEHVVDPALALERAHALLRPGGWIVGQLPTVSSWEAQLFGRNFGGYHYPRHLQVPSKKGLSGLLARTGYVDVHLRTAPHIQSALSLQNTLVRWGWHPEMKYGKTPAYSALLLLVLPYEAVAWTADRGGIMNFRARSVGATR